MKQVIQNLRSGVLKVDEVPDTIVKPGGILVRNVASLISPGTERMSIELAQKSLIGKARERPDLVRQVITKVKRDGVLSTMRAVEARLDAPLAPGYSSSGMVIEVGRGAEEFRVGDRVACAGMNYASHAEVVFIPTNLAVRVPEGVGFDDASFVTLGAIALQGIRTAEVKLGETVAVIGLGLLGQLTCQMLKAAGCRVIGIDLDEARTELARQHGADLALQRGQDVEASIDRFTDGYGADAIIVTAAADTNDPVELAGAIARDRAIVSVVGAVRMEVPRKVYYEKELQLRLSRSYGPGRYDRQYEEGGVDYPISYVRWTERRNMEEFLRLVASGSVRVGNLITHRYPIADAERAYSMITSGDPNSLGIVLTYPPDNGTQTTAIRTASARPGSAARIEGKVRIGLIGAGNFARSALLPSLKKMSDVEFGGVATATGRNAKATAKQFGFEWCTTDYRQIIESTGIDAVLIATRHDLHAEIAACALAAGKATFVEKPLATTRDGLDTVIHALEDAGDRLQVGFNRRFSPLAIRLRDAFKGIESLAMTYRINAGPMPRDSWIAGAEGGGRIVGEVCHFVDFFQFLTGADPVEVFAYKTALDSDNLSVVLKFGDGSTGNINYFSTGDRAFPKERIEIYGSGSIGIIEDFRSVEIWRDGRRTRSGRLNQDKGIDAELKKFVAWTRNGGEPPVPAGDLIMTTLTTFAIERSLESGRPEKVH
jgi:predicted dehydrogenase/threonine dehydrogenase-like Zn-dependent dehydrogenase